MTADIERFSRYSNDTTKRVLKRLQVAQSSADWPRSLVTGLSEVWRGVENQNYVGFLFEAMAEVDRSQEAIAWALSSENDDLLGAAMLTAWVFVRSGSKEAIELVNNGVQRMIPGTRAEFVRLYRAYITKAAWKLSGSGPWVCYPDDRHKEQQEREQQRQNNQRFCEEYDVEKLIMIGQQGVGIGERQARARETQQRVFEEHAEPMRHDVFISYSHEDRTVAEGVCGLLEKRHIRCWIAPRDVPPGAEWAAAIADAIPSGRIFVLVYSKATNTSPQVAREVERAVHHGLMVVTFRTEDAPFSRSLEYFLSSCQWLDALTRPLEPHIETLANRILRLLAEEPAQRDGGRHAKDMRGTAYRLGFTFGKLAWHHGDALQRRVLADQATTFSSELSVPDDILSQLLDRLPDASDPKALLANARSGLDVRNAMSGLLETRVSGRAAAAFRLGFGIVYIVPQFEFMDTGQQLGLPSQEMRASIGSQLQNLIQDAQTTGLDEKQYTLLTKIDLDSAKGESVRMMLITLGMAIDQDLNPA